jgi:hypothetical protein
MKGRAAMKNTLLWLWPLMISACGMPQKPHLDRRDYVREVDGSVVSDNKDELKTDSETLSPEEMMQRDREEMEVLNQTMKDRYRSARGVDLRASRLMLAPGVETATLRSYPALLDKLTLAFGRPAAEVPLSDPSTFTISRALQNDTPNYGASAYRLLSNAVTTLCKGLVAATPARFNVAPTADGARAQCNEWGERFWFRTMNAAEMQICLNTALEVTKATTNLPERWSQICSIVATAPQLLIVDAPQTASPAASGSTNTGASAANIVGDANTGRQLFNASCVGCHGANRPVRARTDAALQAAAANMNHIGREIYLVPPKTVTVATEYHHILAFLKSLGS